MNCQPAKDVLIKLLAQTPLMATKSRFLLTQGLPSCRPVWSPACFLGCSLAWSFPFALSNKRYYHIREGRDGSRGGTGVGACRKSLERRALCLSAATTAKSKQIATSFRRADVSFRRLMLEGNFHPHDEFTVDVLNSFDVDVLTFIGALVV